MTSHAIRIALLLSVLSTAGCGTAANLVGAGPGKKTPFGGVRHDVRRLTEARDGELTVGWGGREWGLQPHQQAGLMILCAADLPLSLVGDVVTWPYARAYSYINQPTDYPGVVLAAPPAPPAIPLPPATRVPADGQSRTTP
jgi:uncharacterized protein YceK